MIPVRDLDRKPGTDQSCVISKVGETQRGQFVAWPNPQSVELRRNRRIFPGGRPALIPDQFSREGRTVRQKKTDGNRQVYAGRPVPSYYHQCGGKQSGPGENNKGY